MGDKELEKICREIYFKHQKTLDLIFEYKPDLYSELSDFVQILINSSQDLILDSSSKTYIRFISSEIDHLIPKEGNGWTKSKRILLWEFQNRNDELTLKLIIGPGEQKIKEELYRISGNHKIFNARPPISMTGSYTQIYSVDVLQKNYLKNQDNLETVKEHIQVKWEKHIQKDIIEIESMFLQEYRM